MAHIQQCNWHLPLAAGTNQRWWTLPMEVQTERLHVNYASLGIIGGGVNSTVTLYVARFRDYFSTYGPVQILNLPIVAGIRYSRAALTRDIVCWGGEYVFVLVASYSIAPVGAELQGPAVAVDSEVAGRYATYNAVAFDPALGVNFNGLPSGGLYNDAALQTDPEFAYNQPWVELHYSRDAFVVPLGEGGGGPPPTEREEIVIPPRDADAEILA